MARALTYTVRELSSATFPDFEKLAQKQGGCWCMHYQRPKPVGKGLSMDERKRNNKKDKEKLVREHRAHAILVYDDTTPVGWCQYGTREELPRIDAGRGYKKIGPPKEEKNSGASPASSLIESIGTKESQNSHSKPL